MTGFSGDSLNGVVSLWSFVAKRLKPVRYYNKLVSVSHSDSKRGRFLVTFFFWLFERSELKNEFEFGFTWMLGLNFRVKKKKNVSDFRLVFIFYFLVFGLVRVRNWNRVRVSTRFFDYSSLFPRYFSRLIRCRLAQLVAVRLLFWTISE